MDGFGCPYCRHAKPVIFFTRDSFRPALRVCLFCAVPRPRGHICLGRPAATANRRRHTCTRAKPRRLGGTDLHSVLPASLFTPHPEGRAHSGRRQAARLCAGCGHALRHGAGDRGERLGSVRRNLFPSLLAEHPLDACTAL